MNGAPPPSRPATPPARPAAPPVGGPPAAPPQQAVVAAPVAQQLPVAPVNVATDAGVVNPPGAPGAAAPAPEKKTRAKRVNPDLPFFHGLFVYNPDGSAVMDQKKDDTGADVLAPRRQRLEGVPALVSAENPAGYNPDTMQPLVPNHFKKRGDFYRFQSALYLIKAAKADAAPHVERGTRGGISKNALQLMQLLYAQTGKNQDAFFNVLSTMEDGAKMVAAAKEMIAKQSAAPAA